jgi:hypothetical protein
MVHCQVTITMSDGSRGKHEGNYSDTVAATMRALELFPEARKINVVVTPVADVIPPTMSRPHLSAEIE